MISILPASILLKSRMSLTSPSKFLPALRMFSAYSIIVSLFASRKTISSMPRIAFNGVRNS